MTGREYENKIRELAFYFFAAPMVILVGMCGVGSAIDIFSRTQNTFSLIFVGVGGVPSVIAYYINQMKTYRLNSN